MISMKSNAIKASLLAGTMFLGFLVGCGADEAASSIGPSVNPSAPGTSPSPSPSPSVNPSDPSTSPSPIPIPSPSGPSIVQVVTYKPFASGHDDKFSLVDFDSPYLVRVEGYSFATAGSRIILNNITNQVSKTDYQGGTYLGIEGFSFNDYTSFIGTNARLTIKVNLVASDGSVITNATIEDGLMVTGATSIYTWQDLQGMRHNLSGEYELMNDVAFPSEGSEGLEMEGFEPVGDDSNKFTGSFAGNGHTITNLFIERTSMDDVGIWGVVDNANSVIKDFVVDHAGISGDQGVGGVVGTLENGIVSNVGMVSSQNGIVSGSTAGGLVGNNDSGRILISYATGAVSGNIFLGGLVGANDTGTVTGYATGAVSGDPGSVVGGLAGFNDGTVTGYATGRVSGTGINLGGLVGSTTSGSANGYWDRASTGQNNSAGGGVGISSIANVVYDSGAGIYADTKGTTDATDDALVFNNAAFLMHFTLPGADATWPTLK